MLKKIILIFSLSLLIFLACNGKTQPPATTSTPTPNTAETTKTPDPITIAPDKLPFEFPPVQINIKPGDTVLAPTRQMIDDSFKTGGNIMYLFYNATVVEPSDAATKVKEILKEETIPNALLIPIKSGQIAKAGDLVLTWWQSGSGMQRAYVTEGGATPKVIYIDGSNVNTETLKADSFNVLSADWQVGTAIACKGTSGYDKLILINLSGDKVLTSGWTGAIKVQNKADCIPVPLKIDIKKGSTIYVAPYGSFEKATVTSVDKTKGKVKAKYEFAESMTEEDFSFGDILIEMPQENSSP